MEKKIRWHYKVYNTQTNEVALESRNRRDFNGYNDKIQAENAAIEARYDNRLDADIWEISLIDFIAKIVVTQYREEHSGSTIGAWLYHYGVDFKGGTYHRYSVETTSEGMGEIMRVFKEAGYEVEYVRGWEKTEAITQSK